MPPTNATSASLSVGRGDLRRGYKKTPLKMLDSANILSGVL